MTALSFCSRVVPDADCVMGKSWVRFSYPAKKVADNALQLQEGSDVNYTRD